MVSEMVKKAHQDLGDGQKGSLCRQRWSKRTIRTSQMVKQKIMTSEIVKKAQYGIRDGKKCSLSLEKWSKWINQTSEMAKMALYDVRDGQNDSL